MSILVTIPGPSASSSKMSKKGWKCWAKTLRSIANPAKNGYDYDGEFAEVGVAAEMEIGSLVVHVDDSASNGIGVVMPNSAGKGIIVWISTGTLPSMAAKGRKYLAMKPEERVAAAAKSNVEKWTSELAEAEKKLANAKANNYVGEIGYYEAEVEKATLSPEARAYYEGLAIPKPVAAVEADPRKMALTQISTLMAQYGITAAEVAVIA